MNQWIINRKDAWIIGLKERIIYHQFQLEQNSFFDEEGMTLFDPYLFSGICTVVSQEGD